MRRSDWMLAGIAPALVAAAAIAGPLNKGWVPADAQWVVHVDVEAGLASTPGSYVREHRAALGLEELDKVKARTGVDPFADIKGVTVFGTTADPEEGVAIIHTTDATDSFLASARAAEKTFTQVTHGAYTLDHWMEHGTPRYGFVRKVGERDRMVLVSQDAERLTRAIALTEAEPTPSSQAKVLAGGPRHGTILFVAAKGVGSAATASKSIAAQKADTLVMEFGEASGEVFGSMVLTTHTEQDAKDLVSAIQGCVALGRLMAAQEPMLAELSKASEKLTVASEGTRINADFRIASTEVVGMLRSLEKTAAEKPTEKPAGKDQGQAREQRGGNP